MILQQKTTEKIWYDEAGNAIPVPRITAFEKNRERAAAKVLIHAQKINGDLRQFKEFVEKVCEDIYESFLREKDSNGTARKKQKAERGNFTFYNFNRTIKVEVNINEQITFDDMTISLCKEKLMEFIGSNITGTDEFIKALVMSAFETSRGKLDTKRVLSLKTHASRIKDKRYHEAMKLLDDSIRRPGSRTYFRVWHKNESGNYENVDLNFSSI